jgi:molecular chaperone IbpA
MSPNEMSPLYRSFIGFDRISDLLENATRLDAGASYPPYDIEVSGEATYRISLATAGFRPDDLEIVSQPNLLVVSGRRTNETGDRRFLHHGLAARAFERKFDLADHVVVKDARYENGLLTIDLARELPEAMKPRRIEIGSGEPRVEATQARLEQADNGNAPEAKPRAA